ncbi:hypothetical protein E3N88_40945 [Mikania micrantha]|uniref:Phorbol-ester/DAG-type domain-containing protein n=1 Tax=Mikania micrantha TaxID=192012 RepID=A0A5N6LRE0_9ASTR|nr:hypothetical protein E3N88_40945 [Mikania micrantha]
MHVRIPRKQLSCITFGRNQLSFGSNAASEESLLPSEVPFYICNQQADEQCCFVLHEWCAKLPLEVQDYAVHGHTLFLLPEVHSKFFSIFKCAICDLPSNGFTYGCMMCEFYIDISCAFMPEEIVHDAHPGRILYKRHPSKTFGEYCKACEVFMHKSWVFHCPSCLEKHFYMRGVYKFLNVKFGGTLKIKGHPHRLTFAQGIRNYGNCFTCGRLLQTKMIFKCLECKFMLHYECASSLTVD